MVLSIEDISRLAWVSQSSKNPPLMSINWSSWFKSQNPKERERQAKIRNGREMQSLPSRTWNSFGELDGSLDGWRHVFGKRFPPNYLLLFQSIYCRSSRFWVRIYDFRRILKRRNKVIPWNQSENKSHTWAICRLPRFLVRSSVYKQFRWWACDMVMIISKSPSWRGSVGDVVTWVWTGVCSVDPRESWLPSRSRDLLGTRP